jgi:hypothetical protein
MLRRTIVQRKRLSHKHIWPIDAAANKPPTGWSGWPENKNFALILTHDVETLVGHDRCYELAKLEKAMGFGSSFNFVPERYEASQGLRDYLTSHGFEVGVHGLVHDGKLYKSRKIFQSRAARINKYLEEWGAVGFRSPAMHHNLEWIHDLNIEYDASTFDTDPFEPQPDGTGTIFPFWVQGNSARNGYVELPYTLPQDFTLFVLMKEGNIDIWKKKLDWIAANGGMALLNTHPDYLNFDGKNLGIDEYPNNYYVEFLQYVKEHYAGKYWHVLPKDLARFWASNSASKDHLGG